MVEKPDLKEFLDSYIPFSLHQFRFIIVHEFLHTCTAFTFYVIGGGGWGEDSNINIKGISYFSCHYTRKNKVNNGTISIWHISGLNTTKI